MILVDRFIAEVIPRVVVEIDNIMSNPYGTVVQPFTDLVGDWFYVIVWSAIAAGVYMKSENVAVPSVVLLLTVVFAAATIDVSAVYIYAILTALGIATVIFRVYRGRMN